MIRIERPETAPGTLETDGKELCAELCALVAEWRAGRTASQPILSFDPAVYGSRAVKGALMTAQHDKCAYCESRVTTTSFGDVEHFRPKGGVRQAEGSPLEQPGYYWLAYEWSNLLVACEKCNRALKKCIFPLSNPARRARSPEEPLAEEDALLIDPSSCDPELHITFDREVPKPLDGSLRGAKTIEVLGLDHERLNEPRRNLLRLLTCVYRVSRMDCLESPEARDALEIAARESSDYSAMVRAALRAGFWL